MHVRQHVVRDLDGDRWRRVVPSPEPLRVVEQETIRALVDRDVLAGSMGPKVEACVWFARASGHPTAIGALADATHLLAGHTGTTITPAPQEHVLPR